MLPQIEASKKLIYLDNAATTPLEPSVEAVMRPFWQDVFGNPSALYREGRRALDALTTARKTVAEILGSRPEEVLFTAGGTESINLAIFGIVRYYLKNNKDKPKPHIITTTIEHHAVLHAYQALEKEGCAVTYLEVDSDGVINLKDLEAAIKPETLLVSVMYANNEIGTIEPIVEIGKTLKRINGDRVAAGQSKIYFHTDACQAAGSLDINVAKLGVDLFSANASKLYGPKQVGFLYAKSGTKLEPIIYGGGQEKNIRSGTENVPGVVGLAESLKLAQQNRLEENKRLLDIKQYFYKQLEDRIPKIVLNGPDDSQWKPNDELFNQGLNRLPNNLNVSILDIEGEAVLLYLDAYNIAASTGSACTSQSLDPSHVILAIGKPYEYAHGSIRFTLGKSTTKEDIDYVMQVLPGIVEELRRISPVHLDPEKEKQISMEAAFVGENMKKFRNDKVKN